MKFTIIKIIGFLTIIGVTFLSSCEIEEFALEPVFVNDGKFLFHTEKTYGSFIIQPNISFPEIYYQKGKKSSYQTVEKNKVYDTFYFGIDPGFMQCNGNLIYKYGY
jgi:hypothetical protein